MFDRYAQFETEIRTGSRQHQARKRKSPELIRKESKMKRFMKQEKESRTTTAKRIAGVLISLAAAAALITGCGSTGTASSTAADSASASAPNASENSSDASSEGSGAVSQGNVTGNVSTNGSTSMEKVIGILSESFMQANSGCKITYDATGSGSGIEAVSNGSTDIGLASRDLKDEEKAKGLEQTTIAKDGIAIIVNQDNPVNDLSTDQIAAIYEGTTTNWKDVDGDDETIAPIGREAGSGTRDGFETITDTKDKCKLSQELTSTGAVIEAVKNSKQAIGYASFSDVEGQDGIKILTVNGVECTSEHISDGTYKIQRNFNLITNSGKSLSDAAQAFFDYMTSKDSASLIEQAGVVPVNQ